MKKLLGSVLALALVAGVSQANAELLKNFKFNGSVEMDATSAKNVLDFKSNGTNSADRIGAAQTRVMLGMDWDLLDDVHAKVGMYKNDQVYGQTDPTNIAGNGKTDANGAQTVQGIQNTVFVSLANIKIDKVFGYVDATFGRQYYGEPGDLIAYYGPKYGQYGMNVTSIDGARFDYAGENAYVTGLAFRPANVVNAIGNVGGALNGQQDIRALMGGNKGNENLEAKVSLWNREIHGTQAGANPTAAALNDHLYVADVKVKGKAAGLYGSAEVAYNFGENRGAVAPQTSARYDGKALLADAGYKADLEGVGMLNPWGQFGWGSGNGTTNQKNHNEDFQSIATDYRPGAIYGRFDKTAAVNFLGDASGALSSNGLTNRIIWGAGFKVSPKAVSKLTAGAAFYDFRLQSLHSSVRALDTAYLPATAYDNRHIGSEVDLTGEWKHSENVSLNGTLGEFLPGGMLRNQGGNNRAYMAAFDVAVKF